MQFAIRFATPDDADTLLTFIQALADYEKEPDAVEVTVDELREQMSHGRPPFECLLAESPERGPVGFALFFHNYSTWRGRQGIYLEDLFVPPEHRGFGIGKTLLTALAQIAVERNCARMEWAVLDWNEPAIGFYEKLGATGMGEWTTFRLTGDALARLGGA